jgi:hypothetical protein
MLLAIVGTKDDARRSTFLIGPLLPWSVRSDACPENGSFSGQSAGVQDDHLRHLSTTLRPVQLAAKQ